MLFPKPEKRKKQKRNREYDKVYLRWIHGFPCIVPGCDHWPVDAHHVDKKSRLGSDRSCLPICHQHHIGGIHTQGEVTCATKWKVDFQVLVEKFNKKFDAGELGPYDNQVPDVVRSS